MTELARPHGEQGTAGGVGSRWTAPAGTAETRLPSPRRVVMTGNVVQQSPPPRPATTSDIAPPPLGRRTPPRPAGVQATVALWCAGCLAALTGVVAALLDSTALRNRLVATATADDPAAPAGVVADGVSATIAVVTGGVTLVVLLSLVWVLLLLRGRSWARWALLATILPALVVLDVAQSLVAGDADVDRMALLAAGGLFVLALLPLLTRSSRASSRSDRAGTAGTVGTAGR
ncbi:hypothetical protein FHR93_004564 [Geodermatophilus sabuli]|uniref:Uncharacterized protein n=1 Tax=Geodermatophilus sabuli TaxID=1564158 RepID=A0A285EGX8_9ACTN|nr:hypothetical protein [Geodermatophilus sabuli]SNX97454.1 hypothetical protein SAMN06893097_10795 [Geodermatophilus sabuli]